MARRIALVAVVALAVAGLAGCSSNDDLAQQFASGSGHNYISGDGALVEIAAADRGEPVTFNEKASDGSTVSSADYLGSVTVINFWYASCPPCRLEAPLLSEWSSSNPEGVKFLGVNVYDGEAAATSFETKFAIPYPSVLDVSTGSMRLAFSGSLPPNAVPVTIVLDKKGRVAARISGLISNISILTTMVDTVKAEK